MVGPTAVSFQCTRPLRRHKRVTPIRVGRGRPRGARRAASMALPIIRPRRKIIEDPHKKPACALHFDSSFNRPSQSVPCSILFGTMAGKNPVARDRIDSENHQMLFGHGATIVAHLLFIYIDQFYFSPRPHGRIQKGFPKLIVGVDACSHK